MLLLKYVIKNLQQLKLLLVLRLNIVAASCVKLNLILSEVFPASSSKKQFIGILRIYEGGLGLGWDILHRQVLV
jgi:hypothetical protein